jgi:glycosyltransferase involved in cell wall biosynthesis
MGKGEQPEQWARERGLHGKVEFRGSAPREVILDFLENEADLMVHTSLIETHGMVLIEAIACGVTVVGGRYSGAVPWTLEEGRSGFLCDVRDVGDLARTIVRARNQKVDKKRDMKLHAWNYVSEKFRIEDAASANVHVLSELKNNKNTTA